MMASHNPHLDQSRCAEIEGDFRIIGGYPFTPEPEKYLPQHVHEKLKRHYEEKLSFHNQQDDSKWTNWPGRTEFILNSIRRDTRSNKNHKRWAENKGI